MSKKHIFLNVFSKITIFACVFCSFFISPVFANLPAGYTELEYIESTGTQYIDLGMPIGTKEKLTFDVDLKKANSGSTFGAFNPGGAYNRDSFVLTYGSGKDYEFYIGAKTFLVSPTIGRHIVKWNGTDAKPTFDGTEFGTLPPYNDFTPTVNAYLFARNGGGSVQSFRKIALYGFEIEGKMKLVPAKRDSDNEIGMYDTVSETFFTNAGTGDFIAGPDVNSIIKIATTKMVDDEFAAAEAKLATTVQTIESVVSRTITQTGQIQVLQDTKQTRPDESCPANMKCLLVQDEDGTPHWYPIIEP